MHFNIYYCIDDNYSESFERCKMSHRLLHFKADRLEVEVIFDPEVAGHSDGQFNLMFKDRNDHLKQDDRKYFTKANWIKRQRLRWMYGRFWVQKVESQAKLAMLGLGYLLGIATPLIVDKFRIANTPQTNQPQTIEEFKQEERPIFTEPDTTKNEMK